MDKLNPRKAKEHVDNTNVETDIAKYPLFFHGIKFVVFRGIRNLELKFSNPITVISGTNKSGKTTALMTIACSHYNFNRMNYANGSVGRATWSDMMRFTEQDQQMEDWVYQVKFREGSHIISRQGRRRYTSKKWSGVAKKAYMIGTPKRNNGNRGREVRFIDLERIVPARNHTKTLYNVARYAAASPCREEIARYLSYVFETEYSLDYMTKFKTDTVYRYGTGDVQYTSFNTASGEDVVTHIISEIVEASEQSLILIEEIEIGLHPKLQRKLMEVLYLESMHKKKQFIVTTHSSTILSSVSPQSRVFINNRGNGSQVESPISTNMALSLMDSKIYPLLMIFVEDELARRIVERTIDQLVAAESDYEDYRNLIQVMEIGTANDTYECFKAHQKTFDKKCVRSGYACILDGDRVNCRKNNELQYKAEELLYFLGPNIAPERLLVNAYAREKKHHQLLYHCENTDNPHCLFEKMVEFRLARDEKDAFEKSYEIYSKLEVNQPYVEGLKTFIINAIRYFEKYL